MNDKEQARTDAIVEVLHHGAGLNDSSIKGTFRIIGKKIAGKELAPFLQSTFTDWGKRGEKFIWWSLL